MNNTEDISSADLDESEQPKPKSLEIITNIIKDASKITNQTNEDSDDENVQRTMNDLINDLQSESIIPDNNNLLPRKSITSGHLIDDQGNSSTPAIIDSSSNNHSQGPIRSMSESELIDHHDTTELPPTLPIQQDESSADDDDDDDGTTTDNRNITPVNTTKQNGLNEATLISMTPRIKSSSSKQSPSTSGDEKRVQLPDETGTDTDRDNQEVANVSRRPSYAKSPVNRPRSPTPDDSRKTLTNQPPTAIISPASRRESTNKSDQQKTSRSSSIIKSNSKENSSESSNNDFLTTNEQLKLIKPGEQLQIPTNEIYNELQNSPPPSPSMTKQMVLINPLLGSSLVKSDQDNSRPTSQKDRKSATTSSISNEKVIDGDILSSKSRRGSNVSQQRAILTDQKPNSSSNRKKSNASEDKTFNKKDSRRSSKDIDGPLRTSAKEKHSGQQSRKNSNITTDQTVISPIKIDSAKSGKQNQKRSSMTDSENEHLNSSKLPRLNSSSKPTTPTGDKQTTHWTKQVHISPLQATDDEVPLVRPQSPNVEQLAERNQSSTKNKKQKTDEQKKKEQQRSLRRSNSAESFNHIQLVDDKSLDSASGNNTESEMPKQRRIKSKKKDVETNTDSKNYLRNGNHQQQQELTPQKPSKSMSDHPSSIRRRLPRKELNLTTPDTEPDSNTRTIRRSTKKSKNFNEDEDPVNVNVTVLVKNLNNEDNDETSPKIKDKEKFRKTITDRERHTQSDTEQIINEKQKKRRRPKRISRTTQTYECVFRRMEREQHEELRPTSDLEKNIQTTKSRLRPRTRSPKRQYPIYLSTNAFKIEELLPKQFPHTQQNMSRTSVVARSNSPQNGKLLILRPTLPFHHSDAVNVQRISLQYAIDLVPNEHKSNTHKQSEQTNNLPMLRSSPAPNASANKSNTKDRSVPSRNEDRTHQRKDGGTV